MPAHRPVIAFVALGVVFSLSLISWWPATAQNRVDGPMQMPQTPASSAAKGPALLVAPFGGEEARVARKAWVPFRHVDGELKSSVGMKLTLIPPGEFQMGSTQAQLDKLMHVDSDFTKDSADHDKPQHRVRITRPYYIGLYEVTRGEFRKFVEDTSYLTDAEKDGNGGLGYTGKKDEALPFENRPNFTWRDWGVAQSDDVPVQNVSHNDAVAFCDWLSKKDGKQYRLPTEAEWEYACRAGTTSLYYSGDDPEDLTKIGNVADGAALEKFPLWDFTVYSSDGWPFTAPVGKFRPNNFGVYDMTGNVWEWCADWYDEKYYANSPVSDPQGPSTGSSRVLRGGGWRNASAWCASAHREAEPPATRSCFRGFRVAADLPGK